MKNRIVAGVAASVATAALFLGASASAKETQDAGTTDRGVQSSATDDKGWRYNTEYLFPLSRQMSDSELPKYGQYALYPLAAALDLLQFPIGALGGLLGE